MEETQPRDWSSLLPYEGWDLAPTIKRTLFDISRDLERLNDLLDEVGDICPATKAMASGLGSG